MSQQDGHVRRLVADLDAHLAKVEADVELLKALLAEDDGEVQGERP